MLIYRRYYKKIYYIFQISCAFILNSFCHQQDPQISASTAFGNRDRYRHTRVLKREKESRRRIMRPWVSNLNIKQSVGYFYSIFCDFVIFVKVTRNSILKHNLRGVSCFFFEIIFIRPIIWGYNKNIKLILEFFFFFHLS